jgi:hypothetical protein
MEQRDGESARGVFDNSSPRYGGRRWNWQRRKLDSLDRFAEALSQHVTEEDVASGRAPPGTSVDPGGNPRESAQRIGLLPSSGNGMLQRIRRRLGPQAR